MYFVGFIFFMVVFSRNPTRAYSEYNGSLVPIISDPGMAQKQNDPNYQAYLAAQSQGQQQYPQANYGQGHPYANNIQAPIGGQQIPAQVYGRPTYPPQGIQGTQGDPYVNQPPQINVGYSNQGYQTQGGYGSGNSYPQSSYGQQQHGSNKQPGTGAGYGSNAQTFNYPAPSSETKWMIF